LSCPALCRSVGLKFPSLEGWREAPGWCGGSVSK
jgi:hypothetical protein